MTTFTPLPSKSPKSPKWGGLFSIAVVLMLVGGGILLVYAATRTKNTPNPASQIDLFSTDAAKTLAALQGASTLTSALPSDTPVSSPVTTGFPQLTFTTPDTTTPASSTPIPLSSPVSSCNGSAYISDVTIPDNTIMAPGATFVKTWALQNTDTCTWNTSYKLVFAGGDQMGGASTNLTASVAPSQQVQVSISLTAPTTAGTYTGYWRLADDQGKGFGGSVTVVIVVSGSLTSTPTGTLATRTPTLVASDTLTPPVATNTETETSAPSRTPRPSRTPTDTPVPPTATEPPVATAAPTQ